MFSGRFINAVMWRMRLVMHDLSACTITNCIHGLGTHSEDRQTQFGVWIVVNVCSEPQLYRLIIAPKKKERKRLNEIKT